MAGYAQTVGLLGLFAWPRRHAILFTLLALALISGLIVNIVLRAIGLIGCISWISVDDGSVSREICADGIRIATYITHGIEIFLLVRIVG